jgi:hypothetical protein
MEKLAVLSLLLSLAACGGGGATKDGSAAATPGPAADAAKPSPSTPDWHPTIKTATLPDDPCALLTAAEVEAVMGKLAAPPRKDDGCRYTLVVPEAVAAKRQQAREMREKFAKALSAYGKPDDDAASKRSDQMFAEEQDPKSYAVTVSVDVKGEVAGERAMDSVSKQLGLTENDSAKAQATPAKGANDWDDVRRISGFIGRTGHIRISVERQSSDVPREQLQALAERVRDKIPDLPFAVTNPYQVMQLGTSGDPCSLLSRAEAESVLGPLAVDPYRSSSNWPPLAHGQGYSCAYYTPGHHVFVLSPTWNEGAEAFKLEKGVGGLVGIAMPQENVVFRGPWEQSHTGMTGELMFLKGDRLLTVHYLTSRATRGDAIKLAAIAMKRLAP